MLGNFRVGNVRVANSGGGAPVAPVEFVKWAGIQPNDAEWSGLQSEATDWEGLQYDTTV